ACFLIAWAGENRCLRVQQPQLAPPARRANLFRVRFLPGFRLYPAYSANYIAVAKDEDLEWQQQGPKP
ncbi:MAG TPA: hypothetical protein VLL04_06625, partial [Rhizomicrobium sp.]|nr:hypothetical protein [Rhizomicrobium sp.]